jgi:hypothetical protein
VERRFDSESTPVACDGCGRDARACGMDDVGWTVRRPRAGFAGAYCADCANALRLLPWTMACSECGSQIDDEEHAERNGWRYWSDELGGLVPRCPACAPMQA